MSTRHVSLLCLIAVLFAGVGPACSGQAKPSGSGAFVETAHGLEITAQTAVIEIEKRQPWVYGPVAEAAARHALELRYSLMPTVYSYERQGTEGNIGLVRPLLWEFPDDAKAASNLDEWMFGDGLLVSPVVRHSATTQPIYLPAGSWFDYASGKRYPGAQEFDLPVDAATWKDIPLFVRAGSILATQPPQQYVGQHPVPEITLDVFPSASKVVFTVYDDDGTTYAYEKGAFMRQNVSATGTARSAEVLVAPATGSFQSAVKTYLVRVHTTGQSVRVNGKRLPKRSAEAFDSSTSMGWTAVHDRFGAERKSRSAARS